MARYIYIIKKNGDEDALACTRRGRSICERTRNFHADTSVVRNVSASAPGILLQIQRR